MGTKLEYEVDVEGAVDIVDHGEARDTVGDEQKGKGDGDK